jgi:SAM-dependent methyltransferase
MSQLALTGERTVPGIAAENYWFRRHEAAYAYLATRLSGQRLLEIGAGEGYGAAMLAPRFNLSCVLDYDVASISHLAVAYPGLRACRANLAALPFRTAGFDVVASLQVIEHVWDCEQFLRECRRVLKPSGRLVLSTPNRLTFSPGLGRKEKPANLFHTREFDLEELTGMLCDAGFDVLPIGLHPGPRLRELDARHAGLVRAQLAAPAAEWSAQLAADIARITAADFAIGQASAACLDLIVQATPA